MIESIEKSSLATALFLSVNVFSIIVPDWKQ